MKYSLLVIAAALSLGGTCDSNPTKGVWIASDPDQDVTAHVEIKSNKTKPVIPLLVVPVPTPYYIKVKDSTILEKPLPAEKPIP